MLMKTKQHEMENVSVAELLLLLLLLSLSLSFFMYLFIFGVWEFRFCRMKRQRQGARKCTAAQLCSTPDKRLLAVMISPATQVTIGSHTRVNLEEFKKTG